MWKKLLFNQFHDIIPGTSITQVYENTAKDYREILDSASNITQYVLKAFTDKKDNYITVFNSLSWERNVFVELPDGFNAVSDMEGNKMNTQRIGNKIVTQVTVPSLGMKSFRVYKDEEINYVDFAKDEYVLENSCLVAKFNEKGELVSLISKDTSKEFLSGPSNRFRLYKDMPLLFDAWDIDEFYKSQEIDFDDEINIEVECNGDLLSVLKVKKRINNSYIIQRAILRKDECKVDFETEIDWRETHKLLKVDFDTNIQTNELISEIQFGHIKRPNHKSRQHDADRFEVCQHKWSALAESNRGLAILNDCKYGVSAEDNTISLTLLKAATAPSLTADKGNHKFVYSIMPFSESLSESAVVRVSYELNCPTYVECGYADERSLVEISNSNIIADTIKQSEDNEGIVMRLYESTGSACDISVSFGFDAEKVYQTDMLENIISDIDVKNRSIQLFFKPFEVITIKIVKK